MESVVVGHFSEAVTNSPDYKRPHRLPLAERISEILNGRVLEIGVGTRVEDFSNSLDIVAIDITPAMTSRCKKMYPTIEVISADVKHLPFKLSSFDAAISADLVHHLVGNNHLRCQSNIKKSS
jgi:ubiquinone/menaquinone biosynthesis C-methylase UbiE